MKSAGKFLAEGQAIWYNIPAAQIEMICAAGFFSC
jgi:hypothetical protein